MMCVFTTLEEHKFRYFEYICGGAALSSCSTCLEKGTSKKTRNPFCR